MTGREEIAEAIRHRRTALGMTQRELADAMGVSSRTVRYVESGQWGASAKFLERVTDVLGFELVLRPERKVPTSS